LSANASNTQGNPAVQREADQERRAAAQARRPLINQWAPDVPTGYIHVDDAIEYIKRRWGKMIRAQHFEAFSRDDAGPKYTIFGDWPDKSRGQRYYAFEDIDMWVYRTISGVPAGWRDIRKLPSGARSTVPVLMVDGDTYGKEQRRLRSGQREDGRGGPETPRPENSDALKAPDGAERKDGDGSASGSADGRRGSGASPTDAGG
jgi:hypothetical protein